MKIHQKKDEFTPKDNKKRWKSIYDKQPLVWCTNGCCYRCGIGLEVGVFFVLVSVVEDAAAPELL